MDRLIRIAAKGAQPDCPAPFYLKVLKYTKGLER